MNRTEQSEQTAAAEHLVFRCEGSCVPVQQEVDPAASGSFHPPNQKVELSSLEFLFFFFLPEAAQHLQRSAAATAASLRLLGGR